ncbi:hypothetical protein SEA_ARCHIE_96 [Mycobacterium phage Archie]|uniref:Uncharacterized protein n=1 Tax=Mycobacterium phage Archie TaxID=1718599 RepID=A0A0M4S3R5_9CAUD|nr:hypothetical protein AVU85_gp096 [Mycobacterium phage Archie]ALF00402.1 hypothetical protein SEA_ARCHIE_96 [Mycobacterium phage Archie]AOT23087.1 hypothetical protein SEA_WILDER_100 [Mycobacterium phage Wilder]
MKPVPQPNKLHQMIVGALLDNKQVYVPAPKGVDGPGHWRGTLANNVSELNMDRAAKRWLK